MGGTGYRGREEGVKIGVKWSRYSQRRFLTEVGEVLSRRLRSSGYPVKANNVSDRSRHQKY